MKYCNKDVIDVMVALEREKFKARRGEDFGDFIRAETKMCYYIKGLQMAGMPEVKTAKLGKISLTILEQRLETEGNSEKSYSS